MDQTCMLCLAPHCQTYEALYNAGIPSIGGYQTIHLLIFGLYPFEQFYVFASFNLQKCGLLAMKNRSYEIVISYNVHFVRNNYIHFVFYKNQGFLQISASSTSTSL